MEKIILSMFSNVDGLSIILYSGIIGGFSTLSYYLYKGINFKKMDMDNTKSLDTDKTKKFIADDINTVDIVSEKKNG